MTLRVLVTDDVDPDGIALLAAAPGLSVDVKPTLPTAELLALIPQYDAIVGRSATRVSAELLERATRLKVVGRAGVGVDNIALDVATARGVAVINAPAGNTVAVAELLIGSLISLLRQLPRADASMHDGQWARGSLLGGELRGRTMGIVGLGRIGSEVAIRAGAFGMPLAAYDPYVPDERFQGLKVRRCHTLAELLEVAQVLTVHTPITPETRGMIGREQLAMLPRGSVVCNLARGGIVDEEGLLAALSDGALGGAVLDVFTSEPLDSDHPLRRAQNVLLTPHIGANTVEAQRNVAVDVCAAVRDALLNGELWRSVNMADVSGMDWADARSALLVAQRAAALGCELLADRGVRSIQQLTLRVGPDLSGASSVLLASATAGMLQRVVGREGVNLINARALAGQRGVTVAAGVSDQLGHGRAVEVGLSGDRDALLVAGVAPADGAPRLTRIGGFHVDVPPRGTLMVLTNRDVPGVIGRVGTVLGDAGVNIAEYHQARLAQGGEALAAVAVDTAISPDVRRTLLDLPEVRSVTVVEFGS
jgi:D-3-phosphoglycerate dehydrogenase